LLIENVITKLILVGATQYNGLSMEIKINALTQFNGALNDEDGSNTENRLVIIIFNLLS